MLLLNPKLAILDETDSGLDVDAIKTVSKTVRFNSKTVNLVIRANDLSVKIKGLVDTGCTLCDPKSNRPVIITDYKYSDKFIKDIKDICLIPYSTVDGGGVFIGFYPDFVKIGKDTYTDVVVAVCYSGVLDDKSYSAIINSDIIKEVNLNV